MSEFNFEIGQGTDKRLVLALTSKGADGTAEVFDLNGYSVAMQLRTATYAPEAIDTLTSANGRLVVDADAGKITVIFPHDITEAYPPRTFVYDVEITNFEGEISRILSGRIKVTPEVTRVSSEVQL